MIVTPFRLQEILNDVGVPMIVFCKSSEDTFFLEAAREISEKWNLFVKRSVPENFGRENFSGQVPTESLRTQDSENVYERWVQQIFDPVSVGRSWMSAKKWGPLAKL